MSEPSESALPILLLGVVFHEARYREDVDELQIWRWPADARRSVTVRRLPEGDSLHYDSHGVLVGVSVHDAARRSRLRLPVRLGDRYRIPPAVLRGLIVSAGAAEEAEPPPELPEGPARELRGLLDAVSDLLAGSADDLTPAELADLHDRLLAAVAEWADPLGIRPFEDGPDALGGWRPAGALEPDDEPELDRTRITTLAALERWAGGERESHPLSEPPIGATDAQLLALLHHARAARLPEGSAIHVCRRRGRLEARLCGAGTVMLDATGRAASSAAK